MENNKVFKREMVMDKEKGCKIFFNYRKTVQNEVFDIREIIENPADRLKFYDLSHNINKKDNSIFFVDTHRTKRYANEDNIAEILDCSPTIARKFVKRMIDIGVYKKVKERVNNTKITKIYVNPLYYQAVSFISDDLYYMFEDYLFDVTSNDMKEFYRDMRLKKESGVVEVLED